MRIDDVAANTERLIGQQITVEGRIVQYDDQYIIMPHRLRENTGDQFLVIDMTETTDQKTARYIQSIPRRQTPYTAFVTGVLSRSNHGYIPLALTHVTELYMVVPSHPPAEIGYVECYRPEITYDDVRFSKLPVITVGEALADMSAYMGQQIRLSGYLTQLNHRETYMVDPSHIASDSGISSLSEAGFQVELKSAVLVGYDNLLKTIGMDFPNLGGRSFGEQAQMVGILIPSETAPFPAGLADITTLALKTMYGCVTVWDLG